MSNKIETKNWTPSQFIAGREALVTKCAELEKQALLVMSHAAIPVRPVAKNNSAEGIINHFDALADHVCRLSEVLSSTTDLTALLTARASAQTPGTPAAQPGAKATAVTATETGAKAKKAFDPDAAILAARGVKSLDELNALGSAANSVSD